MTIKKIWSQLHQPFILDGTAHSYIAAEVEVGEPIPIGKGFKAYVVAGPDGKTLMAESKTGVCIGKSVEAVKRAVEIGSATRMREQIRDAAKTAPDVIVISAEKFWSFTRGAK
jgi:hypothetical protein